jgi:uncharacterized protein YrrD
MLYSTKTLKGCKLDARDGQIGQVNEFYFEDQHWAIRYLVADTGTWLNGRQVLISPRTLAGVDTADREIAVDLTKRKIEDSPSLDSDKPVSRQFEDDYHTYYGWPSPYMWGPYPGITNPNMVGGRGVWTGVLPGETASNPHLRSTRDVKGHHVQAADGEIGHVEDFLIDDDGWTIRYLVIDTRNWWPGRRVLISPQWIDRVSWTEAKIFVNVTRERIRLSPEYLEDSLLTRDDETELYGHYKRTGYWREKITAGQPPVVEGGEGNLTLF